MELEQEILGNSGAREKKAAVRSWEAGECPAPGRAGSAPHCPTRLRVACVSPPAPFILITKASCPLQPGPGPGAL